MSNQQTGEHIDVFVFGLIRSGLMLSELASNLTEALPDDAYPGEDTAAVVLEMLCGTIATAIESVDPRDVRRATEIIDLAVERTREHVALACAMSRRIHGEDGGGGRAYG
jgi:hypothetical protein